MKKILAVMNKVISMIPMATLYYYCWHYLLRAVVPTVMRVKVRGHHHLPKRGPCLLVGNHLSWFDPPILGAYVRRDIRFMTKAEALETWPLNIILPPGDPIKVHRGRADRQALRQAEEHLKQGRFIIIYAEGTRSKSGMAQEARAGVVFLAQRTGAPIVPVAISGSERILSKRFPWYHRARVELTFGAPFELKDLGPVTRSNRDQLAHAVMARVAALLPPAYRGAYGETLSTSSSDINQSASDDMQHVAATEDSVPTVKE
jgi:1-acyl-sn-glycerol-3-phosphate acyltransferase